MPNLVDGLLIAIVAGSALWGWGSGLLRQLVAVSATLVALMVAKQLYQPIGAIFSDVALAHGAFFYDALAYLLVMTFTAAAWFVVIRRIYPYSHVADPDSDGFTRALDNLGGMVLGLILGILLVIAIIGVAELLAFSRWPVFEAAGIRTTLHYAIQDSLIVRGLFSEAPGLMEHVGQWVPGIEIARDGRIQS